MAKRGGARGIIPDNAIRKHVQLRAEHMPILQKEADTHFEGNLSMLIRYIIDWYIDEVLTEKPVELSNL